jgi:hypothetical protein
MKSLVTVMATFVLGAAAALLLSAATQSLDSSEAQPIERDLWEFACATLHDTCEDITPPRVLRLDLYSTQGIYGGYEPSRPWTAYLLIDSYILPQLGRVLYNSVVIHEAVHYIDNARGRLDLTNPCGSESRGWAAGNAYLISMGRVDMVDDKWSERYGCQPTA